MRTSTFRRVLALTLGLGAGYAGEVRAQDSLRSNTSTEIPEEDILELIDDEQTSTSVAEMLSWLRENPVDLNSADRDELLSIPGVAAEDADAILSLRESQGSFVSVDEICGPMSGEDLAARIRPYVIVRHTATRAPGNRPPVILFSSRLSGFLPGTASASALGTLGNPAKSVSRLSLKVSRHMQLGLLFEKDTGERMRDGFASGYVAFRGNGLVEQVILGDFCAEAGQGLVMWRGVSYGRSVTVADGIRKHSVRLVPYHLADESHYLRGGAALLKSRIAGLPIRCSLMLSRTSLAANVDDQGNVTSFYAGGVYGTEEQLEKRNSVHEILAGAHLECDLKRLGTIGLTYSRSLFDRAISQSSPNAFSGLKSEVMGADFAFSVGATNVFGEYAHNAGGGGAWIAGLVIPVDSLFRTSIAYRDYSPDFDNPHASGYGVQSNTTNERGVSIGWSVRLIPGLSLQGYADQCKIPASTYISFLPRTATNFLIQVTALPAPWVRLSFAFRTRKNETMQDVLNLSAGSAKAQGSNHRTGSRFAARIALPPSLEMRLRVEHGESRYSETGKSDKGNIVSQALSYSGGGGMECELGVAFFEADSYDTRLYDFEANLRGSVASPALYGRGLRWHMVASWELMPWARVAAKYAVTLVEKSPVKKELGVQAELRF